MEFGIPEFEFASWKMEFGVPVMEFGTPVMEFGTPEMEFAGWKMEFEVPEMEFASPEIEFGSRKMEFGSQLANVSRAGLELQGRSGWVLNGCVHRATDPTEPGDALTRGFSNIGPMFENSLENALWNGLSSAAFFRAGTQWWLFSHHVPQRASVSSFTDTRFGSG